MKKIKIIKIKVKENYSYKRKVIINDLLLSISIGIHDFEKIKKQQVKFNIEIDISPSLMPSESSLKSIVNYEYIVRIITNLTKKKHYNLIESLAEEIFLKLFEDKNIKKIKIKIEKTEIIKNTSSVGIQITKKRI
tara:strand:- start:323 stop:727 length:405 start_codon:yes stop_codon:yes gene_type:complete